MRLKLSFFLLFIFIKTLCAQNEPIIVFYINNKPVYKSEVEKAYNKNGSQTGIEKESFGQFIEAYIDYRLNLEEAYAQRLDKTDEFERQYKSYRIQLLHSYLEDTVFDNNYLKNIYRRMLEDVEVNHAYIPIQRTELTLFPRDTTAAYEVAVTMRNNIVANGFSGDWYKNRLESSRYVDPETMTGYIGWVCPFTLSSELENLVYCLPVGEISQPLRIGNAYHIVQVLNKRPAACLRDIEQVMFTYPSPQPSRFEADSVMNVANSTYKEIKGSLGFQPVCDAYAQAYGYDKDKGCDFAIVGLDSKLPPAFLKSAFSLEKEGDVSQPVASDFGVHIIRLKKKICLPPFEEYRTDLEKRIKGSDRQLERMRKKLEQMMKAYHVVVDHTVFSQMQAVAEYTSPDSLTFISQQKNKDAVLVSIDSSKKLYVKDFCDHIQTMISADNSAQNELLAVFYVEAPHQMLTTDKLNELFKTFLYSELLKYEKSTIENRNPQFKEVMQGYANDMLVFEVRDENVWDKAVSDTVGLQTYFNQHKDKYRWDQPRFRGGIVYCKDEPMKIKAQALAGQAHSDECVFQLLKTTFDADSLNDICIERGLWKRGENKIIDNYAFSGTDPDVVNENYPYFFVYGEPTLIPQSYKDVRVQVEADYQNQLEKQWTAQLRKKYVVKKNENVIKKLR